jgi:hypothetical protein
VRGCISNTHTYPNSNGYRNGHWDIASDSDGNGNNYTMPRHDYLE